MPHVDPSGLSPEDSFRPENAGQPGLPSALQRLREAVDESTHAMQRASHLRASESCDRRDRMLRNTAAIELACFWEATAPKVGNVHPGAAFDDCCYEDFCRAGKCIAPILAGWGSADSSPQAIGDRILDAIRATRQAVTANVNLGIVLLIAPLAVAPQRSDVSRVLAAFDADQSAQVYCAISLAKPGGVKHAEVDSRWDVTANGDAQKRQTDNTIDLIAAMRLARNRDRIAAQYACDFADFFENVVPTVATELKTNSEPGVAILRAQLRLMAEQPDSLIARKCSDEVALEAMRRATECFDPLGNLRDASCKAFDQWLRADGNRRNPGTTADLIAAAIYWLIR